MGFIVFFRTTDTGTLLFSLSEALAMIEDYHGSHSYKKVAFLSVFGVKRFILLGFDLSFFMGI